MANGFRTKQSLKYVVEWISYVTMRSMWTFGPPAGALVGGCGGFVSSGFDGVVIASVSLLAAGGVIVSPRLRLLGWTAASASFLFAADDSGGPLAA